MCGKLSWERLASFPKEPEKIPVISGLILGLDVIVVKVGEVGGKSDSSGGTVGW
jgi:hypothetical protein